MAVTADECASKAVGCLNAGSVNVGRAIGQLEEAMKFAEPPYKSEIREQIKALQAINFCVGDLSAQLQGD